MKGTCGGTLSEGFAVREHMRITLYIQMKQRVIGHAGSTELKSFDTDSRSRPTNAPVRI